MTPAFSALEFAVAGVLLGGVVLVGIAGCFARALAARLERAFGENPAASPFEWLWSLGARSPANLNLTVQRAAQGRPAQHPLESSPRVDWLSEVGFDPATVSPVPLGDDVPVDLSVVLGPRARRPLTIKLPVLVAPMGYGVGLTAAAKVALARASTLVGTAVGGGEGPYLPEERALATRWVLQWSRGSWGHDPRLAAIADMVEIQVGQGAEASESVVKGEAELPPRAQRALDGSVLRIEAAWPDLVADAVRMIRAHNPDCPIAVKLPATVHLEEDLAALVPCGIDVVTLDGAGAGSADSPAVVTGHFGLDAALAVRRGRDWLDRAGYGREVSLVVGGRVRGASDAAILLALGADAVVVGTSLLFAMSHGQVAGLLPFNPPTSLVLAGPRRHSAPRFNADLATEHLALWFEATAAELRTIARSLSVVCVRDLGPWHLTARTDRAAAALRLTPDGTWSAEHMLAGRVAGLVTEYRMASAALSRVADDVVGGGSRGRGG